METPGMEARRTELRSADMDHANYFAAGAPISFAKPIAFCNWLYSGQTGAILQAVFDGAACRETTP
jgi:hypothetical protein